MAARRYKQARDLTKPELLALAIKRAIRHGFEADYFLADAWFGNKPTLRLTEERREQYARRIAYEKRQDKNRYTTLKLNSRFKI